MCLTNAFLAIELHLNFLARSKLGNQDVSIEGTWEVRNLELLGLIANRYPLELACIDICVVVKLILVNCVVDNHGGAWVFLGASDMQIEFDAVIFSISCGGINRLGAIGLLHSVMVFEESRISFNWDQSHSVSQVLIGDYGGVLPHGDLLNGHGRYLRKQNASQSVSQGRLNSDKVENDFLIVQLEYFNVALVDEVPY